MIQTYSEALATQRAEGLEEGRTLGREEGKLTATRDAILLLARSRVSLPDDFETRLQAIKNLDRLYEILEKISHVERIEDLPM